jgi:hypothetical protein
VHDVVAKAKQVEYLIEALPAPETLEAQVRRIPMRLFPHSLLWGHRRRDLRCSRRRRPTRTRSTNARLNAQVRARFACPFHSTDVCPSPTENLLAQIEGALGVMLSDPETLAAAPAPASPAAASSTPSSAGTPPAPGISTLVAYT